MKEFNVNDFVYIQITEEGWKHLESTVGEEYIKNCIIPYKEQINNECWWKLQLWNVFALLPSHNGQKLLFKTNIYLT